MLLADIDSAAGHETICRPLCANRIIQLRIRSLKPICQEVRAMIHMLHFRQHIVKSITTHMNVMSTSQKV
jgi:hypothetical protein